MSTLIYLHRSFNWRATQWARASVHYRWCIIGTDNLVATWYQGMCSIRVHADHALSGGLNCRKVCRSTSMLPAQLAADGSYVGRCWAPTTSRNNTLLDEAR